MLKYILRPNQTLAANIAASAIKNRENCLMQLPTAFGKSLVIAEICRLLPNKNILILAHRASLIKQNADKVHKISGFVPSIFCAELGSKELGSITLASRGSFANLKEIPQFDLIIIDEVHLLNEEKGQYQNILSSQGVYLENPKCNIIGLTATPWRNNKPIYGSNKLFKKLDMVEYTDDMIAQGYLAPYRFPLAKRRLKTEGIKISQGDFAKGELEQACSSDEIVKQCLIEWNNHASNRKLTLFFCVGVKHAEVVARLLVSEGYLKQEEVLFIHGDTENKVDLIESIQNNLNIRAICSCEILTTGTDIPRIDCVTMLRPTQSAVLHIQCLDLETEILTNNGWKNSKTIKKTDKTLSFNIENNAIQESTINKIIKRKLDKGEFFLGVKSLRQDFCITNKHRLLVKSRRETSYKFEIADKTFKRKDCYHVPVSGFNFNDDFKISDNEIKFIAWCLTDGCIQNGKNNCVTITQSEKKYFAEIIELLNSLNFRYCHTINTKNTNFKRTSPLHIFTINFANPRKIVDRHKTGCAHLVKYLDKSLSFLSKFSKRQFDIFIDVVIKADGSILKNPISKGKKYQQKSFNICKSKTFIENLQIHCIRNNWRADLKIKDKNSYILSVSKDTYKMIGGQSNTDRQKIKKLYPKNNKDCWCVSTQLDTIITRRNGKVLIMGNCLGRGLRLSEGKTDCLFIDIAGNMNRFRSINKPCLYIKEKLEFKQKDDGSFDLEHGEAEQKQCSFCGTSWPIAARVCKACNNLFIKEQKIFMEQPFDEYDIVSINEFAKKYSTFNGKTCDTIYLIQTTDGSFRWYCWTEWQRKKFEEIQFNITKVSGKIMSNANGFRAIKEERFFVGNDWFLYGRDQSSKYPKYINDTLTVERLLNE